MADSSTSISSKLVIILLQITFVICYESMYDIIERKNERRFSGTHEPQYEFGNSNNQDRFTTYNRKPTSIYASIKPNDSDRKISTFGNGFDNLGNGIPNRRLETRRFDMYNRDFTPFYESDRFDTRRFREPSYNRRYYESDPYENRRYDYPEFYRKDYFVPIARPKADERVINLGKKNADNAFEKANAENSKTGITKIDSVISNNEDQNQKKLDSGYHSNEEGAKKDVKVTEKQGESSHVDKNGENKSTIKSNKIARKGHTTKGFSSHHHKDETGNTTTFFDESSDQGGQYDFKDVADAYGDKKFIEHYNDKEDGRFFKENGGKNGNYGAGILRNNQKQEKDLVSNKNYYDLGERYGGNEEREGFGHRRVNHYSGGHGLHDSGDPFYSSHHYSSYY